MSSASAFPPGFGPGTYGSSFADVYDRWYGAITDAAATARFVAARCVNGARIVELGVGTGRLVPELQVQGLTVVGVDSSAEMLAGYGFGGGVRADLAALPFRPSPGIGGALCAFNTLFNLPDANAQAAALTDLVSMVDGPVIIEAITGAALADAERQSIGVSRIEAESLVLAATLVDHDAQTVTGQHVEITEAGIRMRPWHLRWTTPAELDEMATAAGLVLVERFADWNEAPFAAHSDTHISVYRK